MSSAGLILLIAIGAGVAAFVVWPLIFAQLVPIADVTPDLTSERESVLDQIRSLDFDYQTGKLLEDDYQRQRAVLVAQGAAILRELDTPTAVKPKPATSPKSAKKVKSR